ncbi:hypothetical protein [Rhodococcus pyridinivorans]|nr:hypothetical protein [Rhodococcus pyridinivorans]
MRDYETIDAHREDEMEVEGQIDNPLPLTEDEKAKVEVLGRLLEQEACRE